MDDWHGWEELEDKPNIERIRIAGVDLRPGDRVRLRPLRGGDIFDIALNGMSATIEAIMQDFEDKVYVAVTVDDDPGKDFGKASKPAHRFFFSPLEIEPLEAGEQDSERDSEHDSERRGK